MWCERVLRNVDDPAAAGSGGRAVDFVDIEWDECRNVLKKISRGGEAVRVLLPPDQSLRHGDVLFEDQTSVLAVNVVPCELIVARPADAREMALVALELGNLHWPAQVTDDEVCFVENPTALAALRNLGVAWSKQIRRFEPARVSGGPDVRVIDGLRLIRKRG